MLLPLHHVVAVSKPGNLLRPTRRGDDPQRRSRTGFISATRRHATSPDRSLALALVVPMKVQSRELHNYLRALPELPEAFGDSLENVCYATAIVQAAHRAAQLDSGHDIRNLSPYFMLYRVYQADEFYKLVGQLYKELAQTDGTFRVITTIPHTFFVNWYALLPRIRFVVHSVLGVQVHN